MENKIPVAHSRRRLLIYPEFQLTLIGLNLVVMAAAFAAVGVQIQRLFSRLGEMGAQAGLPTEHVYYQFLAMQRGFLLYYILIALGVAFVISLVITLVLSHRLAGPIVRLRGFFKGIAESGQLVNELKFRKGDFFSDLPPVINGALGKIQGPRA